MRKGLRRFCVTAQLLFAVALLTPVTLSAQGRASATTDASTALDASRASAADSAADSTNATAGNAASIQIAAPEWLSRLSLSGRAYLRYLYELGDANEDFNEFAVDRLYLIFMWQIWERGRLRYTLEGGDQRAVDVTLSDGSLSKRSNGALTAVTKHLYFEYQNPLGDGSFVRAGLMDLPFVPYEEALWGYRVQGNVFADRSGYLTSADLGIGAGGALPDSYGSWQVAIVNGEGWRKSEAGTHKDWHARLTVNPLAGAGGTAGRFFLTGFRAAGVNDEVTSGPRTRTRTILLGGYKDEGKLTLAAEQLWATDPASAMRSRYPSLEARAGLLSEASGNTFFATLSPALFGATGGAARLDFLARLDVLDPDDEIANNDLSRFIGGVAYQLHSRMKILLTTESVSYDAGALRPDERRLLLQSEIRF